MFYSEKVRDFVLHIAEKGFITKRSQNFYGSMAYYLAIWNLRDGGLIISDGVDKTRQKIWKMTPKGNKFVKLLRQNSKIEEEMDKLVRMEVVD